jgi:ABC-type bacteriocin/lantibiotic exporter with double-glycine peptidase domain
MAAQERPGRRDLGMVAAVALATMLAGLSGCMAAYTGGARRLDPVVLVRDPGWIAVGDVPVVEQKSLADCGAAALTMVAIHWGIAMTPEQVVQAAPPARKGIPMAALRRVAIRRGLRAFAVPATVADLRHELEAGRPVIIGLVRPHGRQAVTHYEVVIGLHPDRSQVATIDPGGGWSVRSFGDLEREWKPAGRPALIVIPAAETAARD